MALNLHQKYPHVIDIDNGIFTIEQKIREKLKLVKQKFENGRKNTCEGKNLNVDFNKCVDIQKNYQECVNDTSQDLQVDQNEEYLSIDARTA